jgi:hypothetical protein
VVEGDVLARGVCVRLQRLSRSRGPAVGVDSHVIEVGSETEFHALAYRWVERSARRGHHSLYLARGAVDGSSGFRRPAISAVAVAPRAPLNGRAPDEAGHRTVSGRPLKREHRAGVKGIGRSERGGCGRRWENRRSGGLWGQEGSFVMLLM